jgi:hypothetical protein
LRSSLERGHTAAPTEDTVNFASSRKLSPPGKEGIESITAIGNMEQSTISNFYCHGYHNQQRYWLDRFDRNGSVIFDKVEPARPYVSRKVKDEFPPVASEVMHYEMGKTEPIDLTSDSKNIKNTRYSSIGD